MQSGMNNYRDYIENNFRIIRRDLLTYAMKMYTNQYNVFPVDIEAIVDDFVYEMVADEKLKFNNIISLRAYCFKSVKNKVIGFYASQKIEFQKQNTSEENRVNLMREAIGIIDLKPAMLFSEKMVEARKKNITAHPVYEIDRNDIAECEILIQSLRMDIRKYKAKSKLKKLKRL